MFQLFPKFSLLGGKRFLGGRRRCGAFRQSKTGKPFTNFSNLWNIGTIPVFPFNINGLYCSTLFRLLEQLEQMIYGCRLEHYVKSMLYGPYNASTLWIICGTISG